MSSIKTDAEEFVGILFLARDVAHRAHFATDSYAQHVALGSFYEDIIKHADSFAEAWMGRKKQKLSKIPYMQAKGEDILQQLQTLLDVVEESRDFCGQDTCLQNIIDEIVGVFLSTIYKLKFLK